MKLKELGNVQRGTPVPVLIVDSLGRSLRVWSFCTSPTSPTKIMCLPEIIVAFGRSARLYMRLERLSPCTVLFTPEDVCPAKSTAARCPNKAAKAIRVCSLGTKSVLIVTHFFLQTRKLKLWSPTTPRQAKNKVAPISMLCYHAMLDHLHCCLHTCFLAQAFVFGRFCASPTSIVPWDKICLSHVLSSSHISNRAAVSLLTTVIFRLRTTYMLNK